MSTSDKTEKGYRLPVLLPLPLGGVLDYFSDEELVPGTFIKVPLSGRVVTGVVWDKKAGDKSLPLEKLKPVDSVLDLLPLTEDLMAFVDWLAAYTMSAKGAVLKMCMGARGALKEPPVKLVYCWTGEIPERMTQQRRKLFDWLKSKDTAWMNIKYISQGSGVSGNVIKGLVKDGIFATRQMSVDAPYSEPDICLPGPSLRPEQQAAANAIRKVQKQKEFQAILLEGVTGSGKTEVYFDAIARCLQNEETQVLVLLPEIALTSQWLRRFEDRFGAFPVEWHSNLGLAERRRAWRAIQSGQARLVVGARSALFLPFNKLSLIIVDEEHDTSFKQEEGVIYNARDMAVVRAKIGGHPIILSSATPSFESILNAKEGRYLHLRLLERHGEASLPSVEAIDLRRSPPDSGRWISPVLEKAMKETLERREQTLLFLNRRGYAPLTLCRTCGTRIDCPNCTAWLVEHRFRQELSCHHCGYTMPKPKACPECGTEGSLVPCGPGVERIEEEVKSLFPDARYLVMASDTVSSPQEALEQIQRIEKGDVDIIIGTQIVTKGYHFPNMTLVGVVDADLGLKGADLRAYERTYQQLSQVSGRAGRADRPGKVYLQTFSPEHPVTEALTQNDQDAFVEAAMKARELQHVPPYGRMAAIIIEGRDLEKVTKACRVLSKAAPLTKTIRVLGPAPAPLARLKGFHRYRFLLTTAKSDLLQKVIRNWFRKAGRLQGVKIKIDIDPVSFT